MWQWCDHQIVDRPRPNRNICPVLTNCDGAPTVKITRNCVLVSRGPEIDGFPRSLLMHLFFLLWFNNNFTDPKPLTLLYYKRDQIFA